MSLAMLALGLTYGDQGNARCVKHATVFIPAADATSGDDNRDET